MIKLRSEELEALKQYNVEHNSIIKKLEEDILVYTYLTENLTELLREPKSNNEFEPNKTYVVNYEENKIGIVNTSLIDKNGIIDLYVAILSVYRNRGLGSKTLVQMTQFLTEEVKGVEDVRLNVDKLNDKANKIAINNGFEKVGQDEKCYVYRYFN